MFPAEDGGYRKEWTTTRRLYAAMKRAGIPRECPDSGPAFGAKRVFHSLRGTFARIALETGEPLYSVSRTLGHESVRTTEKHYGHFAREAHKQQAKLRNEGFRLKLSAA